MLVLSRKLNEKIQIGDDVSITVLEIKGNKVRIGIAAPQHVRVVRSELPPKQPNPKLNVVVAPEENSTTELAFIPIRETTLDYQQPSKTGGVATNNLSQSRLMEIRQAAKRRTHFQVVAAAETSTAASLPISS